MGLHSVQSPTSMGALNVMLLWVLADLARRSQAATVRVRSERDGTMRAVHVSQGFVVAADSTVQAERLGDLLAAEGRLDPVLIEPVALEASRRQTLLGDQLVADGLLSAADLASALERQVELRFTNAVCTPGVVTVGPKSEARPVARVPLAAGVLALFQLRVSMEEVRALLTERSPTPITLDLESEAFARLGLSPADLRTCRALASGTPLDTVVKEASPPDSALRLAAALTGLGLWA